MSKQNAKQKAYKAPKLRVYGAFSELTASGSGTMREVGPAPGMLRFP